MSVNGGFVAIRNMAIRNGVSRSRWSDDVLRLEIEILKSGELGENTLGEATKKKQKARLFRPLTDTKA